MISFKPISIKLLITNNTLLIELRFCGPKNSGNGVYLYGMLANLVDYPPEVNLRSLAPLFMQMEIQGDNLRRKMLAL